MYVIRVASMLNIRNGDSECADFEEHEGDCFFFCSVPTVFVSRANGTEKVSILCETKHVNGLTKFSILFNSPVFIVRSNPVSAMFIYKQQQSFYQILEIKKSSFCWAWSGIPRDNFSPYRCVICLFLKECSALYLQGCIHRWHVHYMYTHVKNSSIYVVFRQKVVILF